MNMMSSYSSKLQTYRVPYLVSIPIIIDGPVSPPGSVGLFRLGIIRHASPSLGTLSTPSKLHTSTP